MMKVANFLVVLFVANFSFAETVYFLVAHNSRPESYVLPLTDANDIAHARDLIEYGPSIGDHLVVADVACGSDGINRDYLSPTKHLWNWHVTEFVAFANITPEILDGNPFSLLRDCDGWVTNTGGRIGFWSFTVVEELGTDPSKRWQCNFAGGGRIDIKDIAVLAQYWLRNDCSEPDWCGGTDLNYNNIVDLNELTSCLNAWLSPSMTSPIWFDAWDCPTQCHGDANCQSEGRFNPTPVGIQDLAIFMDVVNGGDWPAYCGDLNYDPRADFDRDCDIDENDETILGVWSNVPESQFPTDCPTTP